jgi:transposase
MKVSTIGVDIAKQVFQVHGVDASGKAVVRRKLRRGEVEKFFAGLERCVVGLEACSTAHHWGRVLEGLGHEVRLVPPSYVKPYVKRGKNDAVDAEAICEAITRPGMRFVPLKGVAQQARLTPHRVRDVLIRQRTMLINTLRSQMAEYGVVAPAGRQRVGELVAVLRDEAELRIPAAARAMLLELAGAIEALAPRIARTEKAMVAAVKANEMARRLMTIPGVGPITASAMTAAVGDPARFRSGRHFAAWLGLVARQNSSGGKTRLGRISRMGDRYLRKLLVLGATASLRQARTGRTPLDGWVRRLLDRRPARLVTVALANKTARIVWAVMARGQAYRAEAAAAA